MKQLETGDVVVLKSGGLRMTVEEVIEEDDTCVCVYHDHVSNDVKRATIKYDALQKAPELLTISHTELLRRQKAKRNTKTL